MKKNILLILAAAGVASIGAQAGNVESNTTEPATNEIAAESVSETSEPSESQNAVVSAAPDTKVIVASTTINEKPKFKIAPSGRILADGAVFGPDGHGFTDGVALPDIRIGVSASYGKWSAKVDLGFGNFKFSPKDIFIQYKFNDENLLRGGYFVHQFGYQSATSSSFKCAMEAPSTDDFFKATARNLGLMYVLDKPHFFMGTSVIFGASDNLTADNITRQSLGILGRFVWRPICETGKMVQVGISAWNQWPQHKKGEKGSYSFSANYPTRVVKVGMLEANLEDAGDMVKLSPELLLSYDRFALESQYYYMNVDRHGGQGNYVAQGAYGWLRCLLFGDRQYKYSHADAGIATPGAKTLELVAGYNYTNASHKDIRGGISNDASITFNYYFNKYLLFRLGYRYSTARDSQKLAEFGGQRHVNMVSARIQFKF